MNASAPLVPSDDLDAVMRKVARELALDIYDINQILTNLSITDADFQRIQRHPRFLEYLKTEKEDWGATKNTHERTRIKAGAIMEEFMETAYTDLQDRKQALNHRTELGKLVARIAGMGEPKNVAGGSGPGFSLQINIGSNSENVVIRHRPTVIEHDEYDPLVSPNTLED